jgi:hypothetical protein
MAGMRVGNMKWAEVVSLKAPLQVRLPISSLLTYLIRSSYTLRCRFFF